MKIVIEKRTIGLCDKETQLKIINNHCFIKI